jgi:hypothetical protein
MPLPRLLAAALATTLAAALPPAAYAADAAPAHRDGAHDFDFDLGVWKTDIVRRLHPLDPASETLQMTGIVTVRPVWSGRAQLEEIEVDGPAGHWQAMTAFLYDPRAGQWSMNFASSASGRMNAPMVGGWEGGRAELLATDTLDGRAVLVRGVWSDLTPTSHTYQESFSADGGRTWVVSFTAHKTRQ